MNSIYSLPGKYQKSNKILGSEGCVESHVSPCQHKTLSGCLIFLLFSPFLSFFFFFRPELQPKKKNISIHNTVLELRSRALESCISNSTKNNKSPLTLARTPNKFTPEVLRTILGTCRQSLLFTQAPSVIRFYSIS